MTYNVLKRIKAVEKEDRKTLDVMRGRKYFWKDTAIKISKRNCLKAPRRKK